MKNNKNAFTMMELLISIAIMAMVATVAVGAYGLTRRNARDSRRETDLQSLRQALELYRSDNTGYPPTGLGGWTDLSNLKDDLVSDYIDKIPVDPQTTSTTPYRYKATDLSGGKYYGYCIETVYESKTADTSACTAEPNTTYNYTVENP